MIVRKNISIDQCYIDKLKPYLEKNNGNLSAAIRDAIEVASQALTSKTNNSRENDSKKDSQYAEFRNRLIEEGEFLIIHHTLLEWLVKKNTGLLIDESIINELINPNKARKIPDIITYLNALNEKMGWKIRLDADYNQEFEPETINFTLLNGNCCFREIIAQSLAFYMAKQISFDVQGLFNKSNATKIYFKKSEFLNYQKVPRGLEQYFGAMENTCKEIQRRPEFWKNLIKIYRQQNYQRINLNRKIFEAFVSGDIPSPNDLARNFELLVGKPPEAFTLAEHILIFKEFYLTDGIGTDIEVCTEEGREYIKLIHDYSNQQACEFITTYYSNTLKSIGYPFTVIVNPHMITFEFRKIPGLISHSSEFFSFSS